MTELKPCPFCGGEATFGGSEHVKPYDKPYWYVVCFNCGASVYGNEDKEKAVEAWNRRVKE